MIAVWVKSLAGVYGAEEAAFRLAYSDTALDRRRSLWHHRDEYLVEGGIATDEYHILAIFEGEGPERDVVFACLSIRHQQRFREDLSLGEDQTTHWRI